MVKIVWTEISIKDIKDIYDYIAQNSIRYAGITINKIYQKAQIIIDNPFSEKIVHEFNDKMIREVISGNYKIVYRIMSELQVDILRVYHSARLLTNETLK